MTLDSCNRLSIPNHSSQTKGLINVSHSSHKVVCCTAEYSSMHVKKLAKKVVLLCLQC